MAGVRVFFALVLLLLMSACVPGAPASNLDPISVESGKPFGLRIGQTANIDAERLSVMLLNVVSDSRCPSNVSCAVSGELIVDVRINQDGQDLGTLQLDHIYAYRDQDKKNAGEFNVAVRGAQPGRTYEDYGKPWGRITTPNSGQYLVELVVTKL
jgi:hypothetical protein